MAKRRERPETNAERRLRLNISARLGDTPQRKLADAIGVSHGAMSEMLSGHRSIPNWHVDAIAAFFRVPVASIFLEEGFDIVRVGRSQPDTPVRDIPGHASQLDARVVELQTENHRLEEKVRHLDAVLTLIEEIARTRSPVREDPDPVPDATGGRRSA